MFKKIVSLCVILGATSNIIVCDASVLIPQAHFNAELTTDAEFYQYGVHYKKHITSAADYKKEREAEICKEKSLGRWRKFFSASTNGLESAHRLKQIEYANARGIEKNTESDPARRVGVILRNASAIGDIDTVKLMTKIGYLEVTSILAAYHHADKNGHQTVAQLIFSELISPEKACCFHMGSGWALEKERENFVKREKVIRESLGDQPKLFHTADMKCSINVTDA